MELRSVVTLVRHLAHCHCVAVRQQSLLPLSSSVANLNLLRNSSDGAMHRSLCCHSTSAFYGARLTMQSGRTDVLHSTSRTNVSSSCKPIASGMGSVRGMAGHSKWANIRHIKAAKDYQKSRVIHEYTRKMRAFIKETGQTDPKTSSQLAKLIADAKSKNIPNANIDRVLTQMSSLKNSAPVVFTAKGPSGSVMLVEAITGKINQTKAELQSIVKKCGFSMFEGGSLARMCFEEKGVVQVSCGQGAAPDLEGSVDIAIEAGAEDVVMEEDAEGNHVLQFVCEPSEVYAVKKELEARQLAVCSAEVVYNSTNTVTLDSSMLDLISKAMEKLDEHPDVLRVYINVEEAS